MPPKKDTKETKKVILGRFSHNLKMGVLGLPNVGKSSLFNCLTKNSVPAENYPFCTIDPNEARVHLPDERFDWLCDFHQPGSKVPAYLDVWDIAGLVKGAHEGQGLGNAFLSHIQAVDGLFHVVRVFEDVEVTHVEGNIDPVRDLQIISDELRFKDIARVKDLVKDLAGKVQRAGYKAPKDMTIELETLQKVEKILEVDQKPVRSGTWSTVEIEALNRHFFLTSKPVIYLINMSEADYISKKNRWLMKIKTWVDANDAGAVMIPMSVALESTLTDLANNQGLAARDAYLKEKNLTSNLAKIITTGFKALNLVYFFTAGEDEVKCWTIRQGSLAPQAAGQIHTDFEKGFICAEIMKFDDLKEHKSELAVKAAGKFKQKGRDYVVEDGDIILFKFNAPSQGGKKK
eukprot:TRINITY_DN10829_c0_g1_i1.p1 TRINITY_DN10829_c0_g1~~TRINITY_DN10829_c0_g1_i1.p1  ORF type:complete len:403 (+),score=244.19 TRINITY_DN10829_c0_g1_i1:49-1257(+)